MTATTMGHSNVDSVSTSKEQRKLRKPLIERKRRERINTCLDQLKEAVVGAFRLDQSKLEKADILEMTVKHLQNIQSNKMTTDSPVGLEAQQRYSTGYIQCVHELHNLLLTCEWMDKTLGARLLNHLLKSLPRSKQETCTSALRPATPVTPCCPPHHLQGSPVSCGAATPAPDQQFGGCDVSFARDVASENTEPAPDYPSGPLRQQARRLCNSPRLGSLDMWRPW
ncbi:hairy-related 8.2 [Acipenser oxyrinchus oxyrinchus]|uniref:Hairy-related 8.2 n=1 Tax=Acipenser oxyrinchus oxyrinchus TaxID=40147 RepID=A0AAD8DEW3_ACIOX|nr:hairy-related 8.2 [Acipenser oxyrinchus oxyrinchus]